MFEQFIDFSNALEFLLNIIEFSALVVSFSVFFFLMLNQYSNALKEILEPCGLNAFSRAYVLFLCRKSIVKKVIFIEYAILKTLGNTLTPVEWNVLINEFKVDYVEGKESYFYTVPNCTSLIGEKFSVAIGRYFSYFSKEKAKKVFGMRDREWITKLHVEEAYITPTCLLTGLLSQYEENWSEFIKHYISTVYISEAEEIAVNQIIPTELYFTFAWLLWGPSYELKYKKYWAGLCQLSYGDESNSVPAIANNDTAIISDIVECFAENTGERYGSLISADLAVFEKRSFYKGIRKNINAENAYFYNKQEESETSFALQINDFSLNRNYKAKKYYCTAYVWILFEIEDQTVFEFRPEKSLAFFEHANLTDKKTYLFLIDTLLDKCVRHFHSIFLDAEYKERKYRFACSMNNEITQAFLKRHSEEISKETSFALEFCERIIPESKRSPSTIFSAYDNYFVRSSLFEYIKVDLENKESISLLGEFYTNIYMECFPDENERETFDNLLSYLKKAQKQKEYCYHILLVKGDNGKIIAGTIFDYMKECNTGIIEFITVKVDMQSSGIGSQVYTKVLEILMKDAHENGKLTYDHVFCEIDKPTYSQTSVKKYLHFWNKHKYKKLSFEYIQPALSNEQDAVTGLWLTVSCENQETEIDASYVLQVLQAYMKYAMSISVPSEHPDYIRMECELRRKGKVLLNEIIEDL